MNVRNALWIAGLGSVLALPLAATAQVVTEGPPATEAPAVVQDAPASAVGTGFLRFFTQADGGSRERLWFASEGLLMWTKSLNIPPLASTGPTVGRAPLATPGTIGAVGTMVLVDKQIGFDSATGGRFTLGGWVLPDAPLGIEVSYMFLGDGTGNRRLTSTGQPGSPVLSFPFFDAANNVEAALTNPIGFASTIDVRTATRLQGWEVTAGTDFGNFGRFHVTGLGGYRYLGIDESLTLTTSATNSAPPQVILRTTDRFTTTNAFHGGQLGLRTEYCFGAVTFNATGKVALGDIRQQTSISGSTVTNIYNGYGTPQSFNARLLATGTTSGSSGRDRIALVPEFPLGTAFQPYSWLRLSLGYQGIYLNNVARPTDQIDRGINTSQSPAFGTNPTQILVGQARPALLPVAHSDFWIQGLTAGMEFKF